MKRTKQIESLISEVNDYLKLNHIKETSDPVFLVVTNNLIHQKLYHGFNLYNSNGYLSCGRDTDYIQIY
jgi:hypothetical protein